MSAIQQVLCGYGSNTNPDAVAIYNALVAYWNLDDNNASTQMLDAKNSNHLSLRAFAGPIASSVVSMGPGVGGTGRFMATEAVTQAGRTGYIPRTNTNLDLPNSDFSYGGWFNIIPSAGGGTRFVMGRVGSGGGIQAYASVDGVTDRLTFNVSSNGSSTAASCDIGISTVVATFMLVICTLNRSSNQIEFRVRAVGAGSMTKVTTAFPGALYTAASTSNFNINAGLSGDSTYFSGDREGVIYADLCFYATKAITDNEFNYLYNSGNGKNFTALAADAGH